MNISKAILPLGALIFLLSSCVVSKINPAANTDSTKAKFVIDRIAALGLVVVFPTEYKKERVLRNIAKSKPSIQKDIAKIREQRAERLALWLSEINTYQFSKISILPDSLFKSYIADPENVMSLDKRGTLQSSSLSDIYALYTEYGGFEIKRNGKFVDNPFPNQAKPSKWAAIRDFIGAQGDPKSIKSFFDKLNNNLFEYYNDREGLLLE